jgi:3-dehydroquinate dehydratase/shikimate dehydrogenase
MPVHRHRDRGAPSLRTRPAPDRREVRAPAEAAISATLTCAPTLEELRRIRGVARYLEVRADLAGDLAPDELRAGFDGGLVYTLRSADRGGREDASATSRRRRLESAAERYDLVDLELGRDLDPGLLARIPPHRRRISWHGPPATLAELRARFERMTEVPARLYLLAPAAVTVADGLAPLRLLGELGRTDVTAFATGHAGTWSRLLAPRLGARVIYGRLHDETEPGPISVGRLIADFGLPMMGRLRDLYGLVGGSVEHSLAPRIYNKGFRALGLPALCLPFSTADFDLFWRELAERGLPGLGIAPHGLTVVAPHKEAALEVATLSTQGAREAGAANSLVRAGGSWHAATTTRLLDPLADAGIHPSGRRVAVVGCGGAGRSIAGELHRGGAEVTIVNRGSQRGSFASRLLSLPWTALADFSPGDFDLIVHATPLADEIPFDPGAIASGAAVADLVYRDGTETALIAASRARGITALDGRRILASETAGQFELMTGQPMPPDAVSVAAAEADALGRVSGT